MNEFNEYNDQNSAQLELMFGLVELDLRFGDSGGFFWGGGRVGGFFFIFHLVGLSLCCTLKCGFVSCLEVPKKFLLAKPNNYFQSLCGVY